MVCEYFWPIKTISIDWLDSWFYFCSEGQESSQSIEIVFTSQKYSQTIDQGFFSSKLDFRTRTFIW